MVKNISIILIEPETPGNIGAIARVMKNFNLTKLILINPKCDHLSKGAMDRASHAIKILKSAKIKPIKYLTRIHTLVASTSQIGTDFNISRSPISPEQLNLIIPQINKLNKLNKPRKLNNLTSINKSNKINKSSNSTKIALVFGRESHGLSNEEIGMCDFVITIPTNKKYPVLNLSHAVAIILYELSKQTKDNTVSNHIVFASKTEKNQLIKMINSVLKTLKFQTKSKLDTQKLIWKKILAKSFLTKREAFALMGFFRKFLK